MHVYLLDELFVRPLWLRTPRAHICVQLQNLIQKSSVSRRQYWFYIWKLKGFHEKKKEVSFNMLSKEKNGWWSDLHSHIRLKCPSSVFQPLLTQVDHIKPKTHLLKNRKKWVLMMLLVNIKIKCHNSTKNDEKVVLCIKCRVTLFVFILHSWL